MASKQRSQSKSCPLTDLLRTRRKTLNLSITDVARELRVSRALWSYYEHGKASLPAAHVGPVAAVLQIDRRALETYAVRDHLERKARAYSAGLRSAG